MVHREKHSAAWTQIFCLLFIVFATAGASLPSVSDASPISASGSLSANQRSARSAATDLLGASNRGEDAEEEDEDGEEQRGKSRYSEDFVEKFFQILSGPVGKEAEALVAAVIKLLAEDDRVNWRAMIDNSKRTGLPAATSSQPRDLFLPGKRGTYLRLGQRAAPQFNPTGWRRKRSVDSDRVALQRLLRGVLGRYAALMQGGNSAGYTRNAGDVTRGTDELRAMKRNALSNVLLQRRVPRLKPKRKPLEFNPTGW
ncbi:uncharacterized protein [Littorina saxatilis]|uniref:Transmembrane protein n=1 Tax=Littorina saxatilis TaxID=31220 RepID=A0AAN9G0Y6_9CAEN